MLLWERCVAETLLGAGLKDHCLFSLVFIYVSKTTQVQAIIILTASCVSALVESHRCQGDEGFAWTESMKVSLLNSMSYGYQVTQSRILFSDPLCIDAKIREAKQPDGDLPPLGMCLGLL